MPKLTHEVLARIPALRDLPSRARRTGGWSATPRWKRYAAATVPLLLAGALAATLVLTSDARTQPTSAGQTATATAEPQQAAATPQDAQPPPATAVTIPAAERQQCVDGAALAAHADNPGLADDCALLLAAKDTLRGMATLNWSAATAITDWTGVTVASANSSEPKRVTNLNLDSMSLNGAIPAELSGLSALRQLRLAWNQLTGTIPAELSQLTQLRDLVLGGNQLTGAIPPELGSIGNTLEKLHLSGPQPLPAGIGLTGSIPGQLGNLTGLKYLYLDGNRLTGSIPTQLEDLRGLHKLQLRNNNGLTGCVPSGLNDLRYKDLDQLNLPDCASDAPDTPVTPLPTYTLTVTAGAGGSVDPAGTTTHEEDSEVTLTASWNDATTDSFAGWGGDCSGTATTCVLTIYTDKTVTATFTALAAGRCATTTDADCIRAVYKGAPDDYAQVQDIPADVLLTPDPDGRYQVERGQQITVVTAAPLPADYTRFYLQRQPLQVTVSPTSFEQLIQPVGTTYTFTVAANEAGSNLITFNLTEARPRPLPRPGQKPELGDVVVTTNFLVPTLRYDTLDITGAATTPGSYAFLKTAGDAASAIGNFGYSARASVELRIHPTDAGGTSRADFYDTVKVGDRFDYQTSDLDCAFRFKVASVSLAANPRSFSLQFVNRYGGRCGDFVDDPAAARDVNFVWAPPAGIPIEHGFRVMFSREAHGPGSYRLEYGLPFVIDVPAGSEVLRDATVTVELNTDHPPDFSGHVAVLIDVATGSYLGIDIATGKETHRVTTSPSADALFDHIMASMRRVD